MMPESPSKLAAFLAELKRRRVFRVAAVYACIAFIIFQIVDATFEPLHLPDWSSTLVVVLLVLGFPIAVGMAWAFDLTEEGLVWTKPKREPAAAKAPHHVIIGNKTLALIAVLAIIAAVWSWWERPTASVPGKSIAVLPFVNFSEEEGDWFSDGITDDILTHLSKIGDLKVIARTSSMLYKNSDKRIRDIGRELGVATILEGSVRRADSRVRISSQLVDAETEEHLWAETYDRDLTDIFAIQSDVAQKIAAALKATLTPEEKSRIERKPTENLEAYEFYLRGKYLWEKRQNQQDIVIARGLLEKAIELDNNLLLAKLKLGQSYRKTGDYSGAMKIFHECLEQSIAIGDRISEAKSLSSIGDIHLSSGYYDQALEYYEQSLVLAQYLGDKLTEQSILRKMGNAYYSKDEIEPALKYYKESLEIALELENRQAEGETLHSLGSVYQVIGDYDRAMDSYSQSLRIFHELGEKSQGSYSGIGIGIIYTRMGNYDAALACLLESLEIAREISDKRSEIYSLINIGAIHIQLEQDDKALEYYQQALEIAQSIGDTYIEGVSWTKLGELMARRGKYAQSFQYFNSGCNIWRDLDYHSHHVWTLSWWALSEIRAGNTEEGSRKAGQVETMLAEIQPYEEYVITVDWNLSQTYVELGDTAKAKIYMQKAYTEVMSRAERFTDQKDRKSFLKNIIENRDVISAYQRFGELGG